MGILKWYEDYKQFTEIRKTRDAKTEDERIRTPEGYLLWTNIPLSRTGIQIYTKKELALEDKDGYIQVERKAEDVFNKDSIASFIGKPITNNHPQDWVTHENWTKHSKGIVLNAYKKTGDEKYLYGDILVTDKALQDDIEAGKCELSVGYDAQYNQTEAGKATQHHIYTNHLAVVQKGRAGSFCRIGDSYFFTQDASPEDIDKLGAKPNGDTMDNEAFLKLVQTVDGLTSQVETLVNAQKEAEAARAKAAEEQKTRDAAIAEEAKQKEELQKKEQALITKDDYANVALFVKDLPDVVTVDHKRSAVEAALADKAIAPSLAGVVTDVKTADHITLNAALAVASALKKADINARNAFNAPTSDRKEYDVIASLNKKNADFWKGEVK